MSAPTSGEAVAAVIVTYNRSHLLGPMLDGLAAQTRPLDAVIVIDNASTDDTAAVLAARTDLPLVVVPSAENTGGAGGFHDGLKLAHEQGFDRFWLMDDDVVPAADCLEQMLAVGGPCLIAVREDLQGDLVEKAAVRFDLDNPLAIRPKRSSVETAYCDRASMPPTVPVENAAFEGFMTTREVVDAIGLPDPEFFIFYDDVDFVLRAREAGYPVLAVRDAVLVRQLDFNQQHALDGWKGFYMYRNLFVVHLRHGRNFLVRWKPWLITAGVVALSPLRGGRSEAGNAIRALRAAYGMRRLSESARPGVAR